MITPLGTCLILSTTPYAPLPSSSISSKSSAFTTKFWTRGGKMLLHVLIMQNRNSRAGVSRRNASANFTWSPILTQAFESRSRGGLWGWESNTDLSWVLNKNTVMNSSDRCMDSLYEAMWPLTLEMNRGTKERSSKWIAETVHFLQCYYSKMLPKWKKYALLMRAAWLGFGGQLWNQFRAKLKTKCIRKCSFTLKVLRDFLPFMVKVCYSLGMWLFDEAICLQSIKIDPN